MNANDIVFGLMVIISLAIAGSGIIPLIKFKKDTVTIAFAVFACIASIIFLGITAFGYSQKEKRENTQYIIKHYSGPNTVNEWHGATHFSKFRNTAHFRYNGDEFHITGTFTAKTINE